MVRSTKYSQRSASRYGIFMADSVVSDATEVADHASITAAKMGNIVVDLTTGEIFMVDSTPSTQLITYT